MKRVNILTRVLGVLTLISFALFIINLIAQLWCDLLGHGLFFRPAKGSELTLPGVLIFQTCILAFITFLSGAYDAYKADKEDEEK